MQSGSKLNWRGGVVVGAYALQLLDQAQFPCQVVLKTERMLFTELLLGAE